MSNTIRELIHATGDAIEVITGKAQIGRDNAMLSTDPSVEVRDEASLRAKGIDVLVNAAVFGTPAQQGAARWLIWETGQALGIRPASIHELYIARGRNALDHTFTTPAMNIRMMAYDSARAAIRAAVEAKVGAFIFEIARSEMSYTDQRPAEYTTVMIAAAIKEGYRGPLFIQGDHFQVNAKKYKTDADSELAALRKLIDEALAAGFYNIDIDTSTLVDLSKPTLDEQQHLNYELCALFSDYIRQRQPAGLVVSLGGEIGEVGQKNSDIHELRAFMSGYLSHIKHQPGISKISIQTGTSHGGVVLPDGSIADVNIDFDTLRELSTAARDEYGMGGAVQHGASTLPEEAFGKFVQAGAIEVHLATAFQQIVYANLPKDLNDEMTRWL
ncbi:MAG: class II fructose-bisphosphate aldolase, partial [Thermoflexales bacterium]|nr:class II fructose-bisphosphate aldolase [Thermoflexales bacterium]